MSVYTQGQRGQGHGEENSEKTPKRKAVEVFGICGARDDEMQKNSTEQNLDMKKTHNYLKLRIKKFFLKNKGRISEGILVNCI